MDPSIPHHLRKIRLDTVLTSTNRPANSDSSPPPAYTTYPDQQGQIDDSTSEPRYIDIEDEQDESPHEITIDATTAISGSCNVLQLDIAAQGARLAAALASLLRDSRHGAPTRNTPESPSNDAEWGRRGRPLKITVNCGVKILGQRNLVGTSSMVPVALPPAAEAESNKGGVKRKAESSEVMGGEPAAKCRVTGRIRDSRNESK